MKKILILLLLALTFVGQAYADPEISRVEYFFDSAPTFGDEDPGYGLATSVTITPDADISDLEFTADTSELSAGLHILHVRVMDSDDKWSHDYTSSFLKVAISDSSQITAVEYFFDTDPGYGNGTDVPITPALDLDGVTFTANISGLSEGIHMLHVRSKDDNDNWSLDQTGLLAIFSVPTTEITRIEYFIDTDPGFDNGTSVPFTAGEDVTVDFSADTTGLSEGDHYLFVRSKDDQGRYSLVFMEEFTVYVDSDGDGIPNNIEDADQDGEVDDGETDPYDADTDDDGFDDGVEDADHDGEVDDGETDPTDPNSYPINSAPTVPSLNQPGDEAEVTSLTPTLSVNNASDAEGDTVAYNFELYSDESLTDLVSSDAGVEEGDGTTEWTPGSELSDHTTYYWRCQAYDSQDSSDWMEAQFFVNTANEAPGTPTPSTPVEESSVATLQPTLTVVNSENADQDALTYEFVVYSDEEGTISTASIDGILEGDGTTSWQVNTELTDNTWYWWQARAEDDEYLAGDWTALQSVLIDMENEAPAGLAVSSPEDGEEVTSLTVVLEVTNAADPEGDEVTYDFQIDTVDTFDSADYAESLNVAAGTGGVTSWSQTLSDNTRYYWRTRAHDADDAYGDWVAATFFVNQANDVPTAPGISSPDGSQVTSTTPTLTVTAATDLDQDALTYTFEIYSDAGMAQTSLVVSASGEAAESWETTATLDNHTTYYWRACAIDEHDAQSEWSDRAEFTVNIAPGAPEINSPSDGSVADEAQPTLSVINGEAAGDETLTYLFEIYTDAGLTDLFAFEEGVAEGDTITSWEVPDALDNGKSYYWRVKATDGTQESSWTATAGFLVSLDGAYETDREIEAYGDVSASSTETQEVSVSHSGSAIYGSSVQIGAGLLSEDVTIIIGLVTNPPDLPDDVVGLGETVDFEPEGLEFNGSVTIRIPYSQDLMDSAGITDPSDLSVWSYAVDSGEWGEIEVDSIDTENMVLSFRSALFSIFRAAVAITSDIVDSDLSDTSSSESDDGGGGGCFIGTALGSGGLLGFGWCLIGMLSMFSLIRRKR